MNTKLMMNIFFSLLFLLSISVLGCSHDCDDEKEDTRKKRGAPEETTEYDSGDYHSHDWWYWTQGISYNFTWSNDKDCEVSTYKFDPIGKKWILISIKRCGDNTVTQ